MNRMVCFFFKGFLLTACLTLFAVLRADTQDVPVQRGAKVIDETHHDLSPSLSDLVTLYGQRPMPPAPKRVAPLGRSGNPYSVQLGERDPALQEAEETEGRLVSTTNLLNFDGLTASQSGGVAPPDTNGTVGTTQFVQTVNTAYEVFDKTTGHSLVGPTQINVIFSGFGGACDTGPYFSDPIVLFDKMASRWVVSIIGSSDGFQTGLECVAVSTGSDATSSYYRYSFSFGNNLGNYPKLGSWLDAYYLTVNKFSTTGVLLGADACALDRTSMLAGNPATAQCFQATGVLYTFTGGTDGGVPYEGLVRDATGNIYGTTFLDGTFGYGVVFKLDTTGSETVLHSFTGGTDGGNPHAGVIRDAAGNLYGTTFYGGDTSCNNAPSGCGTVFKVNPTVGTLMPADFDGTIGPAAGEPNFLLSIGPNAPGSTMALFKFHVDFTNPANSTFTGPTTIAVKSYNEACGGQGTCVRQASTSQQLDSLGDRLMFRLAYRNFGDHESLVVNHSVAPGTSGIVAGVRWYEIRNPNGTPTVYQQGTFSSKTTNYWMGSIAMDKNGDMALGFSSSSSTTHPGILYTGRMPTDPLGTMETTKTVTTGSGSQNGGLSRWGDYSSMAIDPSDDCTFWYTNEYLKTTGSFNWDTRIVSFKFNSCQ